MAKERKSSTSINVGGEKKSDDSLIIAYNRIPYSLIQKEMQDSGELITELTEIANLYKVYRKGQKFTVEATAGDYVASTLAFKMAAGLVNKQARFMFAETPDIVFGTRGDKGKVTEQSKQEIALLQEMVNRILEENKFEDTLLKASKDCFIGKRVAGVLNFNETNGVSLQFVPALNFVYEMKEDNSEVMKKFVMFVTMKSSTRMKEKRIYKKKFEMVASKNANGEDVPGSEVCWIEEKIYDGTGVEIAELFEYQKTLLTRIPAYIFVNDGLTGEYRGESEIDAVMDYEGYYSKLSNADMDSERKNMHPIKYTINMDNNSTKKLSTAPGSYWDLTGDQNTEGGSPNIGILESQMSYSAALKITLDRIKAAAYGQVEMPDVTLESMSGVITSGKALKAIYWPLVVRCKEKMKVWGPGIRALVDMIVQGAKAYPLTVLRYTDDSVPAVDYEIKVLQNYPLPEDEAEEKGVDLQEVAAQTLSRKAYMKKWRELSDTEADAELEQMALETQILEGDPHDPNAGMNSGDGTVTGEEDDGYEDDLDDPDEEEPEEDEDDGELDSLMSEIDRLGDA